MGFYLRSKKDVDELNKTLKSIIEKVSNSFILEDELEDINLHESQIDRCGDTWNNSVIRRRSYIENSTDGDSGEYGSFKVV